MKAAIITAPNTSPTYAGFPNPPPDLTSPSSTSTAASLRSAIQIMGSGLRSVPMPKLLQAIQHTFHLAAQGKLTLATNAVPLSTVADTWNAPGNPASCTRCAKRR